MCIRDSYLNSIISIPGEIQKELENYIKRYQNEYITPVLYVKVKPFLNEQIETLVKSQLTEQIKNILKSQLRKYKNLNKRNTNKIKTIKNKKKNLHKLLKI